MQPRITGRSNLIFKLETPSIGFTQILNTVIYSDCYAPRFIFIFLTVSV